MLDLPRCGSRKIVSARVHYAVSDTAHVVYGDHPVFGVVFHVCVGG